MPHHRWVVAGSVIAACHGAPRPTAPPPPAEPPRFAVIADGTAPPLAAQIEADAAAGVAQVEAFFGARFPRRFDVRVLADRAALDAHWGARWQVPDLHTECWMIGMGMADEFSILSPARWRTDACEHDPDDARARAALITHELVHTYHAQVSPVVEAGAEAAESMAWFVEGLAVVVSGQLTDGHQAPASEAIATGHAPAHLAEAWSGKYRYGVSGSLVAYVDATWGRATTVRLLTARDGADLLAILGVDEPTLLSRWQAWVTR